MNTTSNDSNVKVNAVVISEYAWDNTRVDDNRAWYTTYNLYVPSNKSFDTVTEASGFGERITDRYNFIPCTDELLAEMKEVAFNEKMAAATSLYKKYTKELEEYNNTLRPQNKGQIVEILDGKHKGFVGRISWLGKNKYNPTYTSKNNNFYASAFKMITDARPYCIPAKNEELILVRDIENPEVKVYIDINKCKVVEGFIPVTITLDECKNYVGVEDSNMNKLFRNGGYNHKIYVNL